METTTKPFTAEDRGIIRRNAEAGAFLAASVLIAGYEATIAEKDAEIRRLSDTLIDSRQVRTGTYTVAPATVSVSKDCIRALELAMEHLREQTGKSHQGYFAEGGWGYERLADLIRVLYGPTTEPQCASAAQPRSGSSFGGMVQS